MAVYFVQCSETKFIKIGYAQSPIQRLQELQVGSPHKLKLIAEMRGDIAAEHKIHDRFSHYRYRGEWFYPALEILYFAHKNKELGFDLHFAIPSTNEFVLASQCGTKTIKTSAQLIVAVQWGRNNLYVEVDPYGSIVVGEDYYTQGRMQPDTLNALDKTAYEYRLLPSGVTLAAFRKWKDLRNHHQGYAQWKYSKQLGDIPSPSELKDLMQKMYAVLQVPVNTVAAS